MTDDNSIQCAYPILETDTGISFHPGLTKREAFAMAAMQGLLASKAMYGGRTGGNKSLSINAVQVADALLKELEK
jgi:hypothetical protein